MRSALGGRSRAGFDYTEADLRPRGLGHVLLLAVLAFFVAFAAWASWAELEEVTRGQGRVVPSRQTQVVQHLEGGIVHELLVEVGEIVEPGQVLMRIDSIRAASDYRERRARYLALLAAIARLEAEVEERAIQFPEEVLSEARGLAEGENRLFNARQATLQSELEILRRQVEQREQELAELGNRRRQLEESHRLAQEELRILAPLAQQRVVSQTELLRLRRQVNDLEGELEQAKLSAPRIEAAVREARERIANAVTSFRTDAYRELSMLQSEFAGIREVITAGEDRVRRTEVRSPVRGTVKELHFNTIGGVIQPGATILEVTPLDDTLLIEARVRPADIAFISPGLPATVKITAYDFSIYGGLEGRVEHISADTIVDERGEGFYRVRVRTAESALGSAEKPLAIIPGMTAEVDVITGRKTVLDYLLKPILKARNEALRER